jgi:hypothetical protein
LTADSLTNSMGPVLIILGVVVLVLAVAIIWLVVKTQRMEKRYQALTAGTSGGSLEAVLDEHVEQVRLAVSKTSELDALARQLEREGRGHIQRVGFLRFNPFRDAGGDQSFALALTDQDGNGVVLSSLHSRDSSRVYSKPLADWESPYPLTDEERTVINQARSDTR